jgi:hypothetical protein
MSQNLKVLAVGAFAAFAVAALPLSASAGEIIGHCSSGGVCNATFTAGQGILEDDSGSAAGKLSCTSTSGIVTGTSGTSTGTASLTAHGCKEQVFGTSCSTPGQPAGTIKTGNGLVAHLVYIDGPPTVVVGLLITNLNMTLSCAGGLVLKTITGSLIAKIENPECGKARTSFTGVMETSAPGSQKYKQITTTGTFYDLTSGTHTNDTTTSAVIGTGTITVAEGKTVTLTC